MLSTNAKMFFLFGRVWQYRSRSVRYLCGHGKGLVEACSGFGIKDILRKAIILKDWFSTTTCKIVVYLNNNMENPRFVHNEIKSAAITIFRNKKSEALPLHCK